MLNPLSLFHECLNHEEPLVDPAYCNDSLIINTDPGSAPTEIMRVNRGIIDRITAAKIALVDNDPERYERDLKALMILLDKQYVNFVEFTSFWPAMDVSYSVYKSLDPTAKLAFLRDAVRLYIEKRHDIYHAHGYTATSIQVRKDFEKHKTGGNAGNEKVKKLLNARGYRAVRGSELFGTACSYVVLDESNDGDAALAMLTRNLDLRFEWQQQHQGKSADLLFRGTDKRYFICELKHMKEGGGGQDKQVAELISFVAQREESNAIHYVAFLDGIYFNTFANPKGKKPQQQVSQIEAALSGESNNYFVNTFGFERLLDDVK